MADPQYPLGESTDAAAGFPVTYSFNQLGTRVITAHGHGSDDTELASCSLTIDVEPAYPDVPYFYQYDNTLYPSATCQNTSIAMVLAYLGWTGKPDDITEAWGKDHAQTPGGLAEVFNDYATKMGIEWVHQHDGPQKLEGKLLFGGQITTRWFWGANLVYEQELSGEDEKELALTAAVSRTVVDERFSVGIEAKGEMVDNEEGKFPVSHEVLAGPSLQWTPVPAVHIDLVLLFGYESERENGGRKNVALAEPLFVIGYEI